MTLAESVRRMLELAKQGPQPFDDLARLVAAVYGESVSYGERDIVCAIEEEGEGGVVRLVLGAQLARWDADTSSPWAAATPRNSVDRRHAIYDRMELSSSTRLAFDDKMPLYEAQKPTVITAESWVPWYYGERRTDRTFYWDALCGQLREQLNWRENNIIGLDEATTAVVERLWDPIATETYQSKGLVVGYVQSGKTANITGVIAKAVDAGYRLVIVLAGTLNLLREQTQRRIDRELVGAELLEEEYLDDSDWPKFLRHGQLPSQIGAFDWVRLTNRTSDYMKLPGGAIESLRFARLHPELPFNHPDNLHRSSVRLLVVKKNASVLKKLAKDLARVNADGELEQVPALVIDDESDQASVNTIRPTTKAQDEAESTERTRINHAIVSLLGVLKRAQYVGYTATPFANVFVDPSDGADLFPRDFIVSLPRPKGYLGASDFHDLNGLPPGYSSNEFLSNERAFVRRVDADSDDSLLLDAIDSFVISGALKLYRESVDGSLRFKHHTMMIHTSPRTADHSKYLQLTNDLLTSSGYRLGTATDRLKKLFESDFQPVSGTRAPGLPFPDRFKTLEHFVGEMLSRLYHGGEPVLVVNSTADATKLAFDSEPVWKIIVGGAKLSRGFTVEGLTTTYFRRRSRMADTVMQMGRWCGYRLGYDDLVRLFIGGEDDGAYAAFEAVCRDEEAFRQQLDRYATPEDGSPPITPLQVPPLVLSHAEWLRPTSRNKMFNARIAFRNFGDMWVEHRRVVQNDDGRLHNERLVRELLQSVGTKKITCSVERRNMTFYGVVVSHQDAIAFLEQYRWADGGHDLQHELEFMSGAEGDPQIESWQVLLPQLVKASDSWTCGQRQLSVHLRSYWNDDPPLVNAYVGSDERMVAEIITTKRSNVGDGLDDLIAPKRGVLMIYPIKHDKIVAPGWVPTMGISLLFPPNRLVRQVGFAVRHPGEPYEPIIDV